VTGGYIRADQQSRKMATPCLTDTGVRRRIDGSFGRVERVGNQRKLEAMVCEGGTFISGNNEPRTNKTIWKYIFGENILYQLGSNSYH
jgi:hypothetical protein